MIFGSIDKYKNKFCKCILLYGQAKKAVANLKHDIVVYGNVKPLLRSLILKNYSMFLICTMELRFSTQVLNLTKLLIWRILSILL